MRDKVVGPVTSIIDGDTFDMQVTHKISYSGNKYNYRERIRIENIDAPELGTPAGKRSKGDLENILAGKNVECLIAARDSFGRLVATVKIV